MVADHSPNNYTQNITVGGITSITDPSIKTSEIKQIEDFLMLPEGEFVVGTLDLNKIKDYREYRMVNDLFQGRS